MNDAKEDREEAVSFGFDWIDVVVVGFFFRSVSHRYAVRHRTKGAAGDRRLEATPTPVPRPPAPAKRTPTQRRRRRKRADAADAADPKRAPPDRRHPISASLGFWMGGRVGVFVIYSFSFCVAKNSKDAFSCK